ncbi:hypothetical protein PBI_CAMILLE_56 [Microbacterium phage Camille]|nr:hypothetical protein PBI_CAMILLE_56 [Microbacterium phage Camille]
MTGEPIEINTTKRWNHYCRAEASDGRVCCLYAPHEGKHKPKHGTESDRWADGE